MELIENNQVTQALSEQISLLVTTYLQGSGSKTANLHEFLLEQIEPPLLEAVMLHCRYNQTRAAQILGISRGTCRKKLIQYFDDRYCGEREQHAQSL